MYLLKNILYNDKYKLSDLKVFCEAYKDGIKGRLGKRESKKFMNNLAD